MGEGRPIGESPWRQAGERGPRSSPHTRNARTRSGLALLTLPLRGLVAAADAELAENLRHVELDAIEADAQPQGNLLVREPLPQQRQHLPLPRRQHIRIPRPSSSVHTLILRQARWNYTTRPPTNAPRDEIRTRLRPAPSVGSEEEA